MRKFRTIFAFLILLFLLSSCSSGERKKDKQVGPKENQIEDDFSSSPTSAKARKEGEPYFIGYAPDNYSMDFDTSRLYGLEDKKSKFYPKDGVRGIYVNSYLLTNENAYQNLVDLLDSSRLNAVVVDIKDDWGNVIFDFSSEDEDIEASSINILNPQKFLQDMHERGVYVIGRIPTFKDSVLTKKHPEWAFHLNDGSLRTNSSGEVFLNPFLKETRSYILKLAELGCKVGFDEIQFDYVRFPEGFETFADQLYYSKGDYATADMADDDKRVAAITDFIRQAREKVSEYKHPISIDVFGYALQAGRAGGIGRDFSEMANQTDILSSMIYPSHRALGSFNIEKPDLEPYELVNAYLKEEKEILDSLDYPPKSRPRLQDFTASRIGAGNRQEYGKEQVEAQIEACYDQGLDEYLIWNAAGEYSQGVDY